MRNRLTAVVFVSAALAGGCTTASTTPATAPSITALTTVSSTTAVDPSTTTTGLERETTTTLDRLTEIQAIFEDLERRRLQAIYDQDEDAFRSLYANDEYLERSMVLLGEVKISRASAVKIVVRFVRADTPSCIAADLDVDTRGAIDGGIKALNTYVIQRTESGWGLSWVGEGWSCEGPHPLSQQ